MLLNREFGTGLDCGEKALQFFICDQNRDSRLAHKDVVPDLPNKSVVSGFTDNAGASILKALWICHRRISLIQGTSPLRVVRDIHCPPGEQKYWDAVCRCRLLNVIPVS